MRAKSVLVVILLLLPCRVWAEAVAPRELPARCTVAITSKAPTEKGTGSFFGTGSIISPVGYVLTSTTAVPPKATDIDIVSPGFFKLKGTLLAADEKTELSLVRIEPPEGKPLPHFTIRDSTTVQLGEVVMTVSNSVQVARSDSELSVSVGLLSGRYKLTRELVQTAPGQAKQRVYVGEVLETTAATNPGSDGGPLLDGSGQLIGVLTLNVSDARWLGCAVPVEVIIADIKGAMAADLAKRNISAPPTQFLSLATSPRVPLFPKWEGRAQRFREAARRVANSVVAIRVERTKDDPRFSQGRPMGLAGPPQLIAEILKRPNAPVTGVIVGADGWIATSYFNIAGELKSVKVVLADGKELVANVVGWDQERDLALLKVEATGLRAVELSPEAAVGQYVCVLGRSPEPKNVTLTSGIVSAVGRGDDSRLQFDAKANVGNTGGPLIGLDGKCMGVVGGITVNSHHGQNSGIAFATCAAALPKSVEELKKGTKIKGRPHASLGIVMAPGAVDLKGVLVARVLPGSGAEKAGLRRNDSILKLDGTEVAGEAELANLVRAKKPGDKVKLLVRRPGTEQEMELEVTLGEAN